eukprot:CAMPEP_0203899680 /NCGR_PEP_ID=MMETSP0359-20131031/42059_1 /ASSEMBLY_ACC=CAM_ASM_000338 /TAXON_ID=268821 /ORGANISM="Scrippsiella Hangoei, Strain SHTV-5" /LENGTH=73 /DNA_ID=CAMNT_0050822987 /DNA_START=134 /DNA_END=356 /DNA_ORIENTATION=-
MLDPALALEVGVGKVSSQALVEGLLVADDLLFGPPKNRPGSGEANGNKGADDDFEGMALLTSSKGLLKRSTAC